MHADAGDQGEYLMVVRTKQYNRQEMAGGTDDLLQDARAKTQDAARHRAYDLRSLSYLTHGTSIWRER
jgi:hypothetical protein